MKKALLVYRINKDDSGNEGVIKKCKAQARAFQNLGYKVDMIWLCKNGVLKNDELVYQRKLIPHSLSLYWFYFFEFGALVSKLVNIDKYEFIYLRHPFFDPFLVRCLKKIKSFLKIILEINTYPYDEEPKRFLHKLSLWMDRYYRKSAGKFIDVIVHYGVEKGIWKIPTITIRNGIEVDKIHITNSKFKPNKIKLIAIGNWSYWHGLDRLIRGLKSYYSSAKVKEEIYLTIVGDGGEKENLINLVDDLNMGDYVRFFPATSAEKLNDLFDHADIGIGTLGMHRKGVAYDSSLKHREYCCRGIPFILSAPDLDFPNELSFVEYVPNNDTDINLESLLEVFLKWKEKDRKKEIRKYAEEHLTWEKQLLPVKRWLEKNRKGEKL